MYNNCEELINKLNKLKKSEISKVINKRLKQFKIMGKSNNNQLFKELCFCLMTANFNALKSIEIQKKIDDGFIEWSFEELSKKLKEYGHRFPNTRAKYIVKARNIIPNLKEIINNNYNNEQKIRDYLVKNIKGIGYKEASHFLRNIGFNDLSIIDFHIIDLLVKYGLIKRPKYLTKKNYLEIEKVLRSIAKDVKMNLAELDLYLWFMETKKVLK